MRLCHCLAAALAATTVALAVLPALGAGAYRSLRIVAPADQATIHSNEGKLEVAVALTPPLDVAAGDRVALTLDGKAAADAAAVSIDLASLPRGTHTIEAAVVDRDGRVLLRADPVTVYLWHASRLFPNRAGR
ncbi:MAG: hypothetical protein PHY45_15260 [Rhodocyclaceae bacterium]|nr:hypothetical protein [Rhodocyclaceae bacterium]